VKTIKKPLDRRKLLVKSATVLAASPFVGLTGCAGTDEDDTALDDIDTGSGDENNNGDDSNTSAWLSGGTQAMQATFPPASDPFDSGLGNMCTLQEEFTIGPCFFDTDDTRDDISDGEPGVPMTLALKLVDANCQPIEGAQIEVWWCNAEGFYSADNSDARGDVAGFRASYCSGDDPDALASRWFRGIKNTDNIGNVYFKACFPGWYPGRTTHIHLRIVHNGQQQLITQFAFEDDLANNIYVSHPDYTGEVKDTSNTRDNIFSSDTVNQYLFEVERQSDNSMLAYKAIQINV